MVFASSAVTPPLSPPPPSLVENVQLSLVLQTENKGSVVAGGELNVCLDGMVVDLGSLPNGSTAADSESRLYHTHTQKRTRTCTHTHAEREERSQKAKWTKRVSHRGTDTSVFIVVNFTIGGRKKKKKDLSEHVYKNRII